MMDEIDYVLADPAHTLDDDAIAEAVFGLFGFHGRVVAHLGSERDQVALLADGPGVQRVVKISHDATPADDIDLEDRASEWVRRMDPTLPFGVALPGHTGRRYGRLSSPRPRYVRLYDRLPGEHRHGSGLSSAAVKNYGAVTARLGRALRGFFHPAGQRRSLWHVEARHQIAKMTGAISDPSARSVVEATLARFEANVAARWPGLRAQFVHADLTLENLFFDGDNVCGAIDFGDLTHSTLVADIAAALASLGSTRTGDDLLSTIALFLDGYTADVPLEPIERAVLADTVALRLAITLTVSAHRGSLDHGNDEYLSGWDTESWNMLRELDAAGERARCAAFGVQLPHQPVAELAARRQAVFGSVLAPLTYHEPLTPVCGFGAALVDAQGRDYIDGYNNVPVVGHAHPRVAAAIADQARLLSTNLRYLHPRAVELAERLIAGMPAGSGLDTVLFLNSGSEAVDVAWRIAGAATGNTGALVTEFAYHGVTTATTALSPEQWRGGSAPDHVERFPPRPDIGGFTAALDRLVERGHRPAAVFLDPSYTSDGILLPDREHHAAMSAAARRAGALVVADEVQAGFGRAGDHLWSFVGAGLQPDIVTLGKPMGNGHPVAAVIARRGDVEALAARSEFFSTYAGGPVAAAAAIAVLDVIADENLVEHAATMGTLLRDRLAGGGHPAIRAVRGRGLLVGVELAGASASAVLDEARRRGVLIGATGPAGNVLKIRPPLVITPQQVEQIATVVLGAVEASCEFDQQQHQVREHAQ